MNQTPLTSENPLQSRENLAISTATPQYTLTPLLPYELAGLFDEPDAGSGLRLHGLTGGDPAVLQLVLTDWLKTGAAESHDGYLWQALTLAQQVNDPRVEAINLHSIGQIYRMQRQLSAALDSYAKSLRVLYNIGEGAVRDLNAVLLDFAYLLSDV